MLVRTVKTNIYGRRLPIDEQKESVPGCVTCGHPHWDRLREVYVRCALCRCENVGSNNIEIGGEE